jgi:hypothetical protein
MSVVVCKNVLGIKGGGYSTCYVVYYISYYIDVEKYHNDQTIIQTLMTLINPNNSSNTPLKLEQLGEHNTKTDK